MGGVGPSLASGKLSKKSREGKASKENRACAQRRVPLYSLAGPSMTGYFWCLGDPADILRPYSTTLKLFARGSASGPADFSRRERAVARSRQYISQVYIEDANMMGDGTLSMVDVQVGSSKHSVLACC